MSMNRVQFQPGLPMSESAQCYATEDKRHAALQTTSLLQPPAVDPGGDGGQVDKRYWVT